MASILDKFGIKEVGDVTFYHLNTAGQPDYPVLYLDTCKVTSLEQSADEVEAKGGKGNVSLMVWDTNKQLTVNLEDALFSTKSMAIMFGNGTATPYNTGTGTGSGANYIMKSEQFTANALTEATTLPRTTDGGGWSCRFVAPDGKTYAKVNPKFYDENGQVLAASGCAAWEASQQYAAGDSVKVVSGQTTTYYVCKTAHTSTGTAIDLTKFVVAQPWTTEAATAGITYFCSFDIAVKGAVISIDKDSFPGSYYVTIDTYARMQGSGEDDFFQLIMPNCKVQSSNTISMSADGDPSTLTMNLKVQKPANGGAMVYMVKYSLDGEAQDAETGNALKFAHNHVLAGGNSQAEPQG